VFCIKCGDSLRDNEKFCPKCGTKRANAVAIAPVANDPIAVESTETVPIVNTASAGILETTSASVEADIKSIMEIMPWYAKVWLRLAEVHKNFKEKYTDQQGIYILGISAAIGAVILVIAMLIMLIIAMCNIAGLILAVTCYLVYQLFIAKYVLGYRYQKSTKHLLLELPAEEMNAQTIFNLLNGRLNYPNFKGVRFDEQGQCLIEGKYETYFVQFDSDNIATLHYQNDEAINKKSRLKMLEAIAIRHYINKLLIPNLPYDAMKYYNALRLPDIQTKIATTVSTLATLALIIVLILSKGDMDNAFSLFIPGANVRYAYLTQYSSSVTIGEAFGDYFGNGKWSTYTEKGDSYVVFTGTCMIDNQRANIKVTFKVFGEQFSVDSLEVNGRENSLLAFSLLQSVYDDYSNGSNNAMTLIEEIWAQ